MKSVRLLATLFLCGVFQLSSAQTSQRIVADLSKLLDTLENFGLYNKNDSLIDTINAQIQAKISFYIKNRPDTLAKALPKLGAINSQDNVLSILSWDDQMGGTQHSFTNLFLYRTGEHLNFIYYAALPNDGEYEHYYTNIDTLIVGNKTYYLIIYKGIIDINERMDGIQIFVINNGKLNNKARLIKTSAGLTYKLRYRYLFNLDGEGITYNHETKEITFPIINQNERETDGSMVYKFNGTYFERVMH